MAALDIHPDVVVPELTEAVEAEARRLVYDRYTDSEREVVAELIDAFRDSGSDWTEGDLIEAMPYLIAVGELEVDIDPDTGFVPGWELRVLTPRALGEIAAREAPDPGRAFAGNGYTDHRNHVVSLRSGGTWLHVLITLVHELHHVADQLGKTERQILREVAIEELLYPYNERPLENRAQATEELFLRAWGIEGDMDAAVIDAAALTETITWWAHNDISAPDPVDYAVTELFGWRIR